MDELEILGIPVSEITHLQFKSGRLVELFGWLEPAGSTHVRYATSTGAYMSVITDIQYIVQRGTIVWEVTP